MIAILTKDAVFFDYLESLVKEMGFSLCDPDKARLVIVDLDTESPKTMEKAQLTVSSNVFTVSDLTRPFLQKDFTNLVKIKLNCQPMVDNGEKKDEKNRLALDFSDGILRVNGETIALTPAEARLFSLLYENRGNIVPISLCEDACRVRTAKGNSVSVTVASLRKKLDYSFHYRMIESHRKEGYSLTK